MIAQFSEPQQPLAVATNGYTCIGGEAVTVFGEKGRTMWRN